ncbi:MAG: hypothetical protein WB679_01660 [Terracidiphilus sp.]
MRGANRGLGLAIAIEGQAHWRSHGEPALDQGEEASGLPANLVLYCARHDYGSFVLSETGNLKAVMNAMGHADVKSAMVYQHPEGGMIRDALNARHTLRHTEKTDNPVSAAI